jgi:hypothetical protein
MVPLDTARNGDVQPETLANAKQLAAREAAPDIGRPPILGRARMKDLSP